MEVEVVPVAKASPETPDQIIPDHVGSRDHSPNAEDEGAEDVIEIDEWLLTFAGLFRKHPGEDGAMRARRSPPDRPGEVLRGARGGRGHR